MISPLSRILRLRKGAPFVPDNTVGNRYTVAAAEPDGGRTFYCFSAPVYRERDGQLLRPCFRREGGAVISDGTSARISLDRTGAVLSDRHVTCRITPEKMPASPVQLSEDSILCGRIRLTPTTNGLAVEAPTDESGFSFTLVTDHPEAALTDNPKCFALLREPHTPFLTVSAVGTVDTNGRVAAPARIGYDRREGGVWRLTVYKAPGRRGRVKFGIDLYEPKLFRDTTVESRHPGENNAFGGEAFIGRTEAFGEQWLYCTPDTGRLPDLSERPIRRALLRFVRHSTVSCPLRAFRVAERFCSFGSTWRSRKGESEPLPPLWTEGDLLCADITALLADADGRPRPSAGLLLRGEGGKGFTAIGTGDSYEAPVMLELRCGKPKRPLP